MDKIEEKLRGAFLFSEMSDADYSTAITKTPYTVRSYCRGDTIYSKESFKRSLGFVFGGTVSVFKMHGKRRVLLNRIGDGGCFGAATLFCDDKEYPTEIISDEDVTVVFISEDAVRRLLISSPNAAMGYIVFLSERIRFLNGRIDSYAARSAEEKVAKYLREHIGSDGCVTEELNMKQLSSSLGLGRASLYRVLSELEARGCISKVNGKIKILNTDDLERITK